MKPLSILILCVFCFISTFAQRPCPEPDELPYNETAYNILKNLDKSQVPTGILYENVFPMANIFDYTGGAGSDTSNTSHFLQAYSEIYLSAFNNTGMKHYQQLYDDIYNFHTDPKYYHPIGIIDYNYNTIHPDAVNNNLLSVNNQQLFDVPNRPSSPYVFENTRIASVLLTTEYPCLYPGQHYFTFANDFVFSNSGVLLSQATYLKATYNGVTIFDGSVAGLEAFTLPITIANDGQLGTLVLVMTVNNNLSSYIISTCQEVAEPITGCRGQDQIEITGYPFDGGYGEGSYSEKGVATIYYADQNCATKQLRKPIIFVDGFDPTNKQHHEKIWGEYLNFPFREGTNQNVRLGNELLSATRDYDIIILDQKEGDKKFNRGGAGLIENNGLVLAKLLETLYAQHGATMEEDFIVVGASMGGLVSRYGLAWMEANNKPHHTRLFISFDSPQNGAQIPLGLQQTVDYFTRQGFISIFPSIRYAIHQSNAAKQMLLHHSTTNSQSVEAHPFRNMFLNNLAVVGNYPSQCRMVSIANGNRFGILKNIPPSPNPDAIPAINDKDLEVDMGIKRRIFSNCNSDFCYKLHAKVYAQTASTINPVSRFTVNSIELIQIVGAIPYFSKTKFAVNQNGASLDVAPGSRIGTNFLAIAEKPFVRRLSYIALGPIKISTNNLKYSNFIPTTSSVAYTFPNAEQYSVYKNFTNVNLTKCAGTTPFDTVYAPVRDMPHVAIDEFIANSFRSEVYNRLLAKLASCCICVDKSCY